jgi:hypothetical protein
MAQFAQEFAPAKDDHGKITNKDGSYSVRVRHDAKIRVTTSWPEGRIDVEVMTIDDLEGYLLTLGCLYNVSGYYNPIKPKVSYHFVNKRKAFLTKGKLCSCKKCLS